MHLNNGEKTESVTQTTNVSKLRNELQCSYSHVNHIVWRTQIICYRHYKAKKIIIRTATLECTCPRCEHKNIYEPTGSVIQSLADNSGLLDTLFGNVVLFPTSHCLFVSQIMGLTKNETSEVSQRSRWFYSIHCLTMRHEEIKAGVTDKKYKKTSNWGFFHQSHTHTQN